MHCFFLKVFIQSNCLVAFTVFLLHLALRQIILQTVHSQRAHRSRQRLSMVCHIEGIDCVTSNSIHLGRHHVQVDVLQNVDNVGQQARTVQSIDQQLSESAALMLTHLHLGYVGGCGGAQRLGRVGRKGALFLAGSVRAPGEALTSFRVVLEHVVEDGEADFFNLGRLDDLLTGACRPYINERGVGIGRWVGG